jgi:hypothetical protein
LSRGPELFQNHSKWFGVCLKCWNVFWESFRVWRSWVFLDSFKVFWSLSRILKQVSLNLMEEWYANDIQCPCPTPIVLPLHEPSKLPPQPNVRF